MHDEEQYIVRALAAGAKGYLTKRSAAEQLLSAIRKVHAGGRYLGEAATETLAIRMAKGAGSGSPLDALSDREIQVLRGLSLGKSNREIAEAYAISKIKSLSKFTVSFPGVVWNRRLRIAVPGTGVRSVSRPGNGLKSDLE